MIYFSDLLKNKLPKFYLELENLLNKHQLEYKFLKGTKDIWCRDYMPIQVRENDNVLFSYYPSYLKGAGNIRTDNKLVCTKANINYKFSSIILDGGNVVKLNDKAILTDRIFLENKVRVGDKMLLRKLEKVLKSEVIIIPAEEDDVIGHSDGMVRFIDEKTILVNDYNESNSSVAFQRKFYNKLESNNLDVVIVPYTPDLKWRPKHKYDIPSATGVYVNYLQVDDIVLLPQFNIESDSSAYQVLSNHFKEVIQLNCQELACHGGLLNCISWN